MDLDWERLLMGAECGAVCETLNYWRKKMNEPEHSLLDHAALTLASKGLNEVKPKLNNMEAAEFFARLFRHAKEVLGRYASAARAAG